MVTDTSVMRPSFWLGMITRMQWAIDHDPSNEWRAQITRTHAGANSERIPHTPSPSEQPPSLSVCWFAHLIHSVTVVVRTPVRPPLVGLIDVIELQVSSAFLRSVHTLHVCSTRSPLALVQHNAPAEMIDAHTTAPPNSQLLVCLP